MATIEPATRADTRATAALHAKHLDSGLFPQLGPWFLRGYHRSFVDSPFGIALVARDADGAIIGFLFGTSANRFHYQWVVRKRGLSLGWRGGLSLLVRPRLAWLFLTTRTVRYAKGLRRRLSPPPPPADPTKNGQSSVGRRPLTAVLTHVVTDARSRGKGAGRRLVEAFVAEARTRGAVEARLITKTDSGASRFYVRLGWERVRDRRANDGSRVHEYRKPLRQVPAA